MYNILMIDDDQFLLYQYVEVLENLGFNVESTTDLKTFYKLAIHKSYDAIISDINMSSNNLFNDIETGAGWRTGLIVCRKIRFQGSDAKLIALTNSTLPEAVEWFSQDESVAFFKKRDYPPLEFAIALKSILVNPDCCFGEFEEDNTLKTQFITVRDALKNDQNQIVIEKLDKIINTLKCNDSKSFKNSIKDLISTVSDATSIISTFPIIKEIITLIF